jgi:serine/threonine protein kinase/Tfp pilus assembly protein PilF
MATKVSELDDFVERFEAAVADGLPADPLDFAPKSQHPEYEQIVAELIRVDLERSFGGRSRSLTEYAQRFPCVLNNAQRLSEIAFEEYRVRLNAGEPVTPNDYHGEYGIDIGQWPQLSGSNGQQTKRGSFFAISFASAKQQLGEVFPNFELTEELTHGAFARVFIARERGLADRRVVIKVTADCSSEPERLALLPHTSIVPIYSVHREENWQAICMPFFGRLTLRDVTRDIVRHGVPATHAEFEKRLRDQIPHDELDVFQLDHPQISSKLKSGRSYEYTVCAFANQAADALMFAHNRGIAHRDLKPENILVQSDEHLMLLDFNLSRSNDDAVNSTAGGTLPYMSPESLDALQSGTSVENNSDLFSLGVVAYELLTGQLPFPVRSGTPDEIALTMADDRRQKLDLEFPPGTSPGTASIICKCLAADPRQRYQSAADLRDDLTLHLASRPLKNAPNPSIRERISKWGHRHPTLSSTTSILFFSVLALALMVFAFNRRGAHIAELEAESNFQSFQRTARTARTLLGSPFTDEHVQDDGVSVAQAALKHYRLPGDRNRKTNGSLARLPNDEQKAILSESGELLYLLASRTIRSLNTSGSWDESPNEITKAQQLNTLAAACFGKNVPVALQRQAAQIESRGALTDSDEIAWQGNSGSKHTVDVRLRGMQLLREQRPVEAMRSFEELSRITPGDYSAWYLLGASYVQQKQLHKAESCFSTCLALSADSWVVHQDRGVVRLGLREFAAAEQDFDAMIELRPDIAAAYLNRALARHSQSKTALAIDDLSQCIERGGPKRAYFLRSRMRRDAGDATGANQDRETGLQQRPNDEISWIARGLAFLQRDPAAAMADFEQALLLNPHSRDALRNIAHVQSEHLSKIDAAIQTLDVLTDDHPDDVAAQAGRGVLLARQKRGDEAVAAAKRVMQSNPSPIEIYQAGCMYALLSNGDDCHLAEAVRLISRALTKNLSLLSLIAQDSDLETIRRSPDFIATIKAARTLAAGSNPRQPKTKE